MHGAWWRIHHLVRSVLLSEFERNDPTRLRLLHARAAEVFERQHDVAGTVRHLLEARDYGRVIAILSNVRRNFAVPRQAVGLAWLDRIRTRSGEAIRECAFWEAWAKATAGDRIGRDRARLRGREAAGSAPIGDAAERWSTWPFRAASGLPRLVAVPGRSQRRGPGDAEHSAVGGRGVDTAAGPVGSDVLGAGGVRAGRPGGRRQARGRGAARPRVTPTRSRPRVPGSRTGIGAQPYGLGRSGGRAGRRLRCPDAGVARPDATFVMPHLLAELARCHHVMGRRVLVHVAVAQASN
jgi:hypothetical protein